MEAVSRMPGEEIRTPEERTEYDAAPDYPVPGDEAQGLVGTSEEFLEPIPVTIVDSPAPRETWRWAPNRFFINDARVVQVVGRDETRRRLIIRNLDEVNSVYLLDDSSRPTWAGFELPAHEELELLHNDAVWAQCGAGETAYISVASEFSYHE